MKSNFRMSYVAFVLALMPLASPAFAQSCEVKIGAVGPLSGGAAAWGLALKSGAEVIAALHNEAGGLQVGDKKCMVKVVSTDGLYTAAGGAAAANMFASQDIHAVIGPLGAAEVAGFKPISNRANMVGFTTTYAFDAIGPEFPLMFKAAQGPSTFAPVLVKAAVQRFKPKSIVLIAPNDQSGADVIKPLKVIYENEGVKATEEYYQRGTTNFAPLATRVASMNADAIDVASVPPVDQIIIFKQLLETGWKGVIGSLGGGGEKTLIEGADSAKNIKGAYWLEVMDIEQPGATKLKDEFKRLMNADAPINSLFLVYSNATEVLLAGISKAGTDKDGAKIAEALRTMQPESRFFGKEGWRGKSQFGSNQELAFPVGLGIFENGKRVGMTSVPIPTE